MSDVILLSTAYTARVRRAELYLKCLDELWH